MVVGFVEREATPKPFLKPDIRFSIAYLSLSNTVSIIERSGGLSVTSPVHNWVHDADRQSEDGHSPDHVAVDETVLELNDEQHWPYAAVDPEIDELRHRKPETTRTNALTHACFTELRDQQDVDHVPRTTRRIS